MKARRRNPNESRTELAAPVAGVQKLLDTTLNVPKDSPSSVLLQEAELVQPFMTISARIPPGERVVGDHSENKKCRWAMGTHMKLVEVQSQEQERKS